MHSLVYTSEETWRMSRQDLLLILSQSRKNNEAWGITGLLVYHAGRFLQVLEGSEDNVMDLYKNINDDSRNKNVTTILNDEVSERNFPDWTMAFVSISEEEKNNIRGFSKFLEPEYDVSSLIKLPKEVFELLLDFRRDATMRKMVDH